MLRGLGKLEEETGLSFWVHLITACTMSELQLWAQFVGPL